jgi:HlyD family secretion protein
MTFLRKHWRVLLFSAVGLALLVYAFLPGPVPVDLAEVTRGPMRLTVDDDGKTRIKEKYAINAPVNGHLMRITLKEGHEVVAGQTLLAIIEPTHPALLDARAGAEAEAKVRAATANRDMTALRKITAEEKRRHANNELERTRDLARTKSVAREESDRVEHQARMSEENVRIAEQAVRVAEFELEQAKAAFLRTRPRTSGEPDLGRFEILSPISGKVLKVFEKSATTVAPGAKLLELGDPDDLEVEIDVLSQEGVKVKPGARVVLEHWGGPVPLEARVRLVEPGGFLKISALGVEEQRVNVIADFAGPRALRNGLGDAFRVEARIVIWEGDKVLKVPAGALFRSGEGFAVYAVVEGAAAVRPVRVGRNNGLEAEVLGGLAEGERVVVHPSDRVRDGVRVEPR